MSSFGHFLKCAAVTGVAFAASSAPSVAWASTAAPSSASAEISSTSWPGWITGTIGPLSYAISPSIGAVGYSVEGVGSCGFVLRANALLPAFAGCSVNGQSFYVYSHGDVFGPPFTLVINGQTL
jgi:hypothetical protein